MDGDVSDAGGGGEDEGKEGGTEESEERGKSTVFDDFELVFFCSALLVTVRFTMRLNDAPSEARFLKARAA